ncbi:unnamed protein product [Camellia sinensis]
MGACVSVQRHPDSNMKFRLSFPSKTDNLVIPSPIKEKSIIYGDRPIAQAGLKSQWSPSLPVTTVRDFVAGSKEEAFFDSQPWLESDCDDDFFSVNGDLTPSHGSTPVHHSFCAGTARANRALFDDKTPRSQPEPSPRKTLADFFRDSLRSNQDVDEQNILSNQNGVNEKIEAKTTMLGLHPISVNGTPFVSGANSVCSSERTPNGDYRPQKEKPMKSVQCCLPRILSSRSFNERKKWTSPARSVG